MPKFFWNSDVNITFTQFANGKMRPTRKIILVILLLFSAKAQAQYVLVPDSNFRKYIKQYVDSNAIVGDSLDTTNFSVINQGNLNIACPNLIGYNLEGIQYFDNLQSLSLNSVNVSDFSKFPPQLKEINLYYSSVFNLDSANQSLEKITIYMSKIGPFNTVPKTVKHLQSNLSDFPINSFPDSLVFLDIFRNDSLFSVPSFPSQLSHLSIQYSAITYLPIVPDSINALFLTGDYNLTLLPILPYYLDSLYADQCALTELVQLPPNLSVLYVYRNHISYIDYLPMNLIQLELGENELDSISYVPASVKFFGCYSNHLHSIPALPDSLLTTSIGSNPLDSFPHLPEGLLWIYCSYTVSCLPLLPNSLRYIEYDHCIPNRPPNLQTSNQVCNPPLHYFDVPDSLIGDCNDSLSLIGSFSSILWSDGDTSQTKYNLCPGTYTCTAVSTENCYYSNTFEVGGLPYVTYQIQNGCGSSYSNVDIHIGGGNPPYTFQLCGSGDTINPIDYLFNLQTDGWGDGNYTCLRFSDTGGNIDTIEIVIPVTGPPLYYIHVTDATCPTSNDGYYYSVGYQAYFNDCEFSGYDLTPGIYQAICAYNINCVDTYEVQIGSIYSSCDSLLLDNIYMPTCGNCNGFVTINCNSPANFYDMTDTLGNSISYHFNNGCIVSDSVLCPGTGYYLYGDLSGTSIEQYIYIPFFSNCDTTLLDSMYLPFCGNCNGYVTINCNSDAVFTNIADSAGNLISCHIDNNGCVVSDSALCPGTGYYLHGTIFGTTLNQYIYIPSLSNCDTVLLDCLYIPTCGNCSGYATINCNSIADFVDITDTLGNLIPVHLDSSGCVLTDSVLCAGTGYYLHGNFFGAPIEQYIYVPIVPITESVYPGDVNNDSIANNLDLLYMGIAFGDSGSARCDSSITWSAKYAQDWINRFRDSTNYKHADCNGDGIITKLDKAAINLNYEQASVPYQSTPYIPGAPELFLDIPDTLHGSTAYIYPIRLGDSLNPLSNFYGIKFSVYCDTSIVHSNSLDFSLSPQWLGNINYQMEIHHIDTVMGRIDVAITLINHSDKVGFGDIGRLKFFTKQSIAKTLRFYIGNITCLSHDENNIPVNGGIDSALMLPFCHIAVSPVKLNSCTGFCNGRLELNLYWTSGKVHYDWSNSQRDTTHCNLILPDTNNLANLPTGIYQCIYTDSLGCSGSITRNIISEISNLSAASNCAGETCAGCDGSIDLSVSGGHLPYRYDWSNSSNLGGNAYNSEDLVDICLNTETFRCIIRDSLNCQTQRFFDLIRCPSRCSTVYPGDANDDGVANNLDLLSIGFAFGDTGTARMDTSLTWLPHDATDWINIFADNTNHKHADCNGSGIIDSEDTIAIIQNYGLTHLHPTIPYLIQGAPSLTFDLPGSLSSNATYQVPVLLGDSAIVADSIYGIAFSIVFDPSLIQSSSVSFTVDSNWLGSNGDDLIYINHNDSANGNLEVGVTRTDHVNRSGHGKIGTLIFKTNSIPANQTVYFSSANITSISNDETYKPINISIDSVILQAFVSNFVYIPDSNFRRFIKLNVDTNAIVGDSLDTSSKKVISRKQLTINYLWNVHQIEGIQYFDSLQFLWVSSSTLDSIKALPPLLTFLDITQCYTPFLCNLPPELNTLRANQNNLSSLPPLPSKLKHLYCDENNLVNIPTLPDSLITCSVRSNSLSVLDSLPPNLNFLDVSGNNLDSIPSFPSSLETIRIVANNLSHIPELPDSLKLLNCDLNPLIELPELKEGLLYLTCWSTVSCMPHLPNSLLSLYYDGCVSNRPPNINNYPLCSTQASLIELPDSVTGICNDTLRLLGNFNSYLWSTGDTVNPLVNICRGVYTCTSTNLSGCIYTSHIDIQDSLLSVSAVSNTELACHGYGSCDYIIDVTVTGGTPPYSFQWNHGPTTTEDLINFCVWPGDWEIEKCIVTDAANNIDSIQKKQYSFDLPEPHLEDVVGPICPGTASGIIFYQDSPNLPGGEISILDTYLDTGVYTYYVPYGDGTCYDTIIVRLDYQFLSCRDAYTLTIIPPDPGLCNGTWIFTDNTDEDYYNVYGSDNLYLSYSIYDINGWPGGLCPNTWYYIEVYNDIGFYDIDSFYISLPGYSSVYPGDANNDGIVNNVDLLNIGIAYNDTGFTRIDTTITFDGKPAKEWTTSFANGLNHNYADCNGNGIINDADTLAIYNNYWWNHPSQVINPFIAGFPSLIVDLPPLLDDTEYVSIPLLLGDSILTADSIYGLAFTINYDPAFIDFYSVNLNTDSSWIGLKNTDLISMHRNGFGYIETALTRIDHTNRNGYGAIGTLQFRTKNITGLKKLTISITDISAISKDETSLVINGSIDSTIIDGCELVAASVLTNGCANPCDASIQLQVSDFTGHLHYNWSAVQFDSTHCVPSLADTNYLSSLPTGTYQCIITDSVGCADTISTSVISEISTLAVNAVTQREGCDSCNGYINLNVGGGYAPYVFAWDTASQILGNNNFQQQNISSICLSGANFICTVTDSLGCEKLYNEIFADNNCLPANWIDSIAPECNNGSGYLNLTPLNPLNCSTYSGIFTFSPPGATIDYTQFPLVMVNPAPAGNYIYSFSSANGCAIDSVVYLIPYLNLSVVTIDPTCGWCNGIAVALINNDTLNNPGAIIQWSNDTLGLNGAIDSFLCQSQQVNYFISSDGCELSSSFILDSCNLIQSVPMVETGAQQFQILPNPNHGSFTLQLVQSGVTKSKIEIINALGEIIYTSEMQKSEHKKEIKLTHFQSGLFTCRIISNDKVMQQMFVVE